MVETSTAYNSISTIHYSKYLKREVRVDFYFPAKYPRNCRLLILNDGQDAGQLMLKPTLNNLYAAKKIQPLIVAAIYAGEKRMLEYGIASKADYLKRGRLAKYYTQFVIKELLPLTSQLMQLKTTPDKTAVAGFSLGGLTAFDLTWNHPEIFGITGVFSGSFWWRKKDYTAGYTDNDRIMHEIVRKTKTKPELKCWIQTGTDDEKADRNKNGIIDSIDDSLDLIKEMKAKGFSDKDIQYVEIKGGQHNQQTWASALPMFLQWAFGNKKKVDIY